MRLTIRNRTIEIRASSVGLAVVVCALLVTAPRIAHAFMLADGLAVDAAGMLAVTGIASGVVLTLGNAYLTHTLAMHFAWQRPISWLLVLAWLAYLTFAVVLIAPAIMVGLRSSPLAEVMPYDWVQWTWAVVAALSVEVLVAGSMAAMAIARDARSLATPSAQPAQERADEPAASAADTRMADTPLVMPSFEVEAVAVAANGNGHHATEDAQPVCKRCGQAYSGNAGSHWTWDCPRNPNRRKRKGVAVVATNGH